MFEDDPWNFEYNIDITFKIGFFLVINHCSIMSEGIDQIMLSILLRN